MGVVVDEWIAADALVARLAAQSDGATGDRGGGDSLQARAALPGRSVWGGGFRCLALSGKGGTGQDQRAGLVSSADKGHS